MSNKWKSLINELSNEKLNTENKPNNHKKKSKIINEDNVLKKTCLSPKTNTQKSINFSPKKQHKLSEINIQLLKNLNNKNNSFNTYKSGHSKQPNHLFNSTQENDQILNKNLENSLKNSIQLKKNNKNSKDIEITSENIDFTRNGYEAKFNVDLKVKMRKIANMKGIKKRPNIAQKMKNNNIGASIN